MCTQRTINKRQLGMSVPHFEMASIISRYHVFSKFLQKARAYCVEMGDNDHKGYFRLSDCKQIVDNLFLIISHSFWKNDLGSPAFNQLTIQLITPAVA